MKSIFIFALFWLGAAVYHFYIGHRDDMIFNLSISSVLFLLFWFFKTQEKKSNELLQWLKENKDDIIEGQATYNGFRIFPDTELIQYQACISFIWFIKRPLSRYYIDVYETPIITNLFFILISLVFGWWAIPMGPIYTIKVVTTNLLGGKKTTVEDVLHN